jgi:hypothetical protein
MLKLIILFQSLCATARMRLILSACRSRSFLLVLACELTLTHACSLSNTVPTRLLKPISPLGCWCACERSRLMLWNCAHAHAQANQSILVLVHMRTLTRACFSATALICTATYDALQHAFSSKPWSEFVKK